MASTTLPNLPPQLTPTAAALIWINQDGDDWRISLGQLAGLTSGIIPVEAFIEPTDNPNDASTYINRAMVSASGVSFIPGKTYNTLNSLIVPVTCRVIYGFGAIIKGPGTPGTNGAGTTVDGFTYTGWYAGGGHINPLSSMHYLPDVINCRRPIALESSSWVNAQMQYAQNCASGIYCHASGVGLASYCVQNIITIQTIQQCGSTLDIGANILSGIALQGNIFNVAYSAGNNNGILQTWGTTNPNFDQNTFNINIFDANGALGTPPFYAVKSDVGSGGTNFYNTSGGLVPNANWAPNPWLNIGLAGSQNTKLVVGDFQGNASDPLGWTNWDGAGPKTTVFPSFNNLIVNVSTTGSDAPGMGGPANPYQTINYALAQFQNLDLMNQTVTIQLAHGTYAGGLNYNSQNGASCRGLVVLQGDLSSPASVIVEGASVAVLVQGAGSDVALTGLTIQGSPSGLVCSNGAFVSIRADVIFGAITGVQMTAQQSGVIRIASGYTISSGALAHWLVSTGGYIDVASALTISLTGTPAFGGAFAEASQAGVIDASAATFSGAATGTRYAAATAGGINTSGGGANFLPGNAGGSATAPGWYA